MWSRSHEDPMKIRDYPRALALWRTYTHCIPHGVLVLPCAAERRTAVVMGYWNGMGGWGTGLMVLFGVLLLAALVVLIVVLRRR